MSGTDEDLKKSGYDITDVKCYRELKSKHGKCYLQIQYDGKGMMGTVGEENNPVVAEFKEGMELNTRLASIGLKQILTLEIIADQMLSCDRNRHGIYWEMAQCVEDFRKNHLRVGK